MWGFRHAVCRTDNHVRNAMPLPPEIDPILLDRMLAGIATPSEQAEVAAWIAADPRHAAMVAALDDVRATRVPEVAGRTDVAWQSLQARINAQAVTSIRNAPSLKRSRQRTAATWWGVAAVLAISVGGATLWRGRNSTVELVTLAGQRASTKLPDGSRMTLAGGSRATWSRQFGSGAREVLLEGEATFDVVHDTTQPFRVRVGENVAEDVGTKFVVRASPEISGVEVAVEEGAVALSRASARATLLVAGDRGRISADGSVLVTHDGAMHAAWARGEFVFDNTALTDALPALSRWYGVTITASPSMNTRRVTGQFMTLPLDPLLESLALALDAKVSRNGSVITISPH